MAIVDLVKALAELHNRDISSMRRALCDQGLVTRSGQPYSHWTIRAMMMARNYQAQRRHASSMRRTRLTAARQLGRHTAQEWRALVAVFGGRCTRCGVKPARLTKDHIRPLYREGASDAIANIQPVCPRCNAAKGPEMTDHRETAEHQWPPARIQQCRARLGESTEVFGARFARSGRTVEDWEQGRRCPDPLVLLALELLDPQP